MKQMGIQMRWQGWFRLFLIYLLVAVQIGGGYAGVASAETAPTSTRTITIPQAVEEAAQWILSQGPVTEDWYAYTLSAAGKTVESGYLTSAAQRAAGFNQQTLPTTYAKMALGVKAAGGDPAFFAGINLLEKIYNHSDLTMQGNNAVIYGLLALNSGSYSIPSNAVWNQDKMVAWLVQHQISGQGWALKDTDTQADLDLTGAALWALSPYKDRAEVQNAVSSASAWLASKQSDNGDMTADHSNSNTLSMIVLGLSSQQKDVRQGSFSKPNGNPISSLFQYVKPDGGFSFKSGDASDGYSTYQAMLALIAYNTLTGGQGGSYEAPLSSGNTNGKAAVFIHIEKPDATMAEGQETAANPLEALQLLTARNNLTVKTADSPYFDVTQIGTVAKYVYGSEYDYWGFNIKRNGKWTGDWDWKNTQLQNGDEISVFYGPYGTSKLLDSIVLTPESPKNNEPFQVKVTAFDNGGTSVAAAVYVQVGDQRIWTDTSGTAYFPNGFTSKDSKIDVTGSMVNGFPSVIRGVKALPPNVAVRVEGPQGTMTSKTERGSTVYQALSNSVTSVVYTDGLYFGVNQIDHIDASGSNWWGFAVRRAGDWASTDGWKTTPVQEGDEVVIYYSTLDTQLVKSLTVTPTVPKAGQSFSVKVDQVNWQGTSAAAGVNVQIGSLTALTNDQGVAVFSDGLPTGTYDVFITGYRDQAAPKIVRFASSLSVADSVTSGVAGSVNPVVNAVTVNVEGDDSRGVLLSSQQISLVNGDTAYSVLVRALGADRVESAGSGSNIYVSGIDGLRQFDDGPKSGWVYAVNCAFPSVSAGGYTLRNGDRVDWRYTKDGGDDVKAKACSASSSTSSIVPVSPFSSEVESALSQFSILYSNREPVNPQVKTITVLNADQKMNASQVEELKQELANNKVKVEGMALASKMITLSDDKAEVKLQVPPLALKEDRTLSIQKLDTKGGPETLSSIYEFGPSGTTFDKPVALSIKIPLDVEKLDDLALVWLNEETKQWIPIPAVVDAKSGVVTGSVNHFTKFAVIDKSKLNAEKTNAADVGKAVDAAVRFVQGHKELSDWEAYALSTAGVKVPDSYLASAESLLKEKNGALRNVTDYERLAIGIKAAGGNPRNTAGFDLIDLIFNNDRMTVQGTNGPIFALLVLAGGGYTLPSDVKWTKEKLIDWLLQQQNSDGGWPLSSGDGSNIDLTGMAIVSLSSYQEQADVKKAVDRALQWLSKEQLASGGFRLGEQENSESTAQVLMALSSLGIDASDSRFTKPEGNVLTYLLSYQQADGGFSHIKGEASGSIPTEQALLALGMYKRNKEKPVVSVVETGYADTADISAWAGEYVKKAKQYRLMEGMGEKSSRFAPQEKLTRAQFVTTVLRLMGVQPVVDAKQTFGDVLPGSWYFGAVSKAVELGIVNGVNDETFAPDESITRQDMAVVLARAFHLQYNLSSGADSVLFNDMNEAYEQAVPAIGAVYANGYMEGDDHGRFQPTAWVTREMAAAVMVRAYEKKLK